MYHSSLKADKCRPEYLKVRRYIEAYQSVNKNMRDTEKRDVDYLKRIQKEEVSFNSTMLSCHMGGSRKMVVFMCGTNRTEVTTRKFTGGL